MSRSTVILLATSMVVLLGAVSAARADVVYEWTDAKGQLHYTDQWVPGAKLVRTDTAHRPAADSGATQGIQNESNAASHDLKDQQDTQAVQQDEAKARAARCAQDKQEYQKLIDSRRIYTTDKSGQRTYLSDADADAARLRARQAMDADCGS
ncbi:MAG TPA: DUF4124 domain-containing protein [Steroidobacteraceae bacterium]|jgi:hypothetical protein|nr:DUF4124 domain-containing protein [Steroidobacteraceae bacterium]